MQAGVQSGEKTTTRGSNALSCGEFRGESKKQRPPGGSFGKGLAVALESHGHDGGVTRTCHIGIGCWFQQSVMVSREAAARRVIWRHTARPHRPVQWLRRTPAHVRNARHIRMFLR